MSEDFNEDAAEQVPTGNPEDFPEPGETGESPDTDPTTGAADSEPTDLDLAEPEPTGRLSGIKNALSSTTPSPKLSEVESPWNPEEGGLTRVYRGIQKATNSDGMPAWADILIGAIEEYVSRVEPETSPSETPEESPTEGPDMGGEIAT